MPQPSSVRRCDLEKLQTLPVDVLNIICAYMDPFPELISIIQALPLFGRYVKCGRPYWSSITRLKPGMTVFLTFDQARGADYLSSLRTTDGSPSQTRALVLQDDIIVCRDHFGIRGLYCGKDYPSHENPGNCFYYTIALGRRGAAPSALLLFKDAFLRRKPKRAAKDDPESGKTHRWEPFSKRIARLKIDPIHVVQNGHSGQDVSEYARSYFRPALDEWAELNLSATFTSFTKSASPLCETLPQLLHHADRIFELLVEHIEKRDALALEPLMSLTAHFAHDLGKEFEKYFARAVSLTADVAATHEAADAVEWCFTSMAWLFKHLSRLLVPDLRPLLGIMTPYLSHRKEYVARFSAESLAFLLRKAMSQYQKQKAPLTVAVGFLVESVVTDQNTRTGILMLLVESCLGSEGMLHSAAENMMRCLFRVVSLQGFSPECQVLLDRFVVGLAHRTTSEGFQPILSVIIGELSSQSEQGNNAGLDCSLSLVQAAIGTRKGARILSWKNMLGDLVPILQRQNEIAEGRDQRQVILSISALAFQYAPVNELLPFSTPLLELSTHPGRPTEFFGFCTLVADLGKDRFQEFVLPRLQQYILSNYMDDEVGLIYLLQRLHGQGLVKQEKEKAGFVRSAEAWDKSVIARLSTESEPSLSDESLISIAKACQVIHFPSRPADREQLGIALGGVASRSFTDQAEEPSLRQRVSAGWCFESSISLETGTADQVDKAVGHLLHAPEWCYQLRPFLNACSLVMSKAATSHVQFDWPEKILDSLTEILLTSSSSTKISSLKLLQQLRISKHSHWLPETVAVMLELCQIDYLPGNTRNISMLLRRLPQQQKHAASSVPWAQRLIPNFCLGMLPTYFDKTRRDLCLVLAEVLEDSPIQDPVLDILCEWLRSSPRPSPRPAPQSPAPSQVSTFECFNLNQVRKSADEAFEIFLTSSEHMKSLAEDDHQLARVQVPEHSRELALEVLGAIPALAERRSRLIIPIFVSMPFGAAPEAASHSLESTSEPSDAEWTFTDRRAFVRLIRQFQNPRVLYQSAQVRDILMTLLQNGNAEMRKLALESLLKWKDPILQKHEEVFLQLIEEKASNAEIGAMLNAAAEQNPISAEDRPTVLPILLRLLYGSIVGRSGSYGSQEARRKSILRMLFRMDEAEVAVFLDIALGSLKQISVSSTAGQVLESNVVPVDQQYGFLRLMLSLLDILQTQFAPFGHIIADAVLYCTLRAYRQADHAEAKTGSLHRSIRRTGLQCLESLFRHCPDIEWERYMPALFLEAISPRLEAMPAENAQAVSALLRIFSVWSQNESYIRFLLDYDARLPGALWQSLTANAVKAEVQSYILNEIIQPLLSSAQKDSQSSPNSPVQRLLVAESDALMNSLGRLLESQPSRGVVAATTSIILALAPLNSKAANSDNVLRLLLDLLHDGHTKSSPATRASAVAAVQALLEARPGPLDESANGRLMDVIAPLYHYFKDYASRLCLGQIIRLSSRDPIAASVADLCDSLNAASTARLDELDYDRRVQGYEKVKSLAIDAIPPTLWRPIVFNLVFFAKDEDFTIRSNALAVLKDFIGRASASGSEDLADVVKQAILPAVQAGMNDESETIRADLISVFGLLIRGFGQQLGLQDLEPLLVGGDDEANFFNNIMHIQHHRRARAIRRLTSEVEQGRMPASSISKIFLPLLLKFVKDAATDDSAQSLKGQSIQALSTLLSWIEWRQFRAFFKRTKQELEAEEQVQRTAIKVLMIAAEALTRAWDQRQGEAVDGDSLQTRLAATLPPQAELEEEVKSQLLTKLADFIHYREEAEMSARLPAATVAVHLIKLVPAQETQLLAAPIVLDVANVLRSRSSESRDAARRTLAEIVKLLGPTSLLFVLKEMRTALRRGYQLHVLSYTLHSILVSMSPTLQMGDLDYCLDSLVAVIMDDIFGIVGQEKENQDYISSMKEVKSSKSFDSMEILARSASLSHLIFLLDPIVTMLSGSLTSKQLRRVDDLLRRVGIGLTQNPAAGQREVLTFAYQVIERFYKEKATAPRRPQTHDEINRARFLIKHVSDTKASTASQTSLSYKIARFAIDNVRSALQRHPELLQPENVAGFLPVIGDALVEAQEDVKVSALRLLSAIIRLRMPELDQNAPVYVLEAVRVVRHANSTNDEAAQAALKLVAAVLRERKSVAVRDSDVAELLRRVSPDLEEPDRQGVTFNFIRAVMSRKYQLPELYEIVDKIGIMMVTNQTRGARDVARGVYVQFLLDYAQSAARWAKQQKFLIKNLQYEYGEGRESVMEAINMLVSKTAGEVSQELIAAFFIPVVLRLANDDNQGCRDLAGALLGQLFTKVAPEKSKDLLEPLWSWINQTQNQALAQIGMQVFTILFDTVHDGLETEVKKIKQSISDTLDACDIDGNGDDEAADLLHRTLALLLKLADSRPAAVFSHGSGWMFESVRRLVGHRDARVQSEAASIVAAFLRSCKPASISKLPLTSGHGLKLDEAGMRDLLRATVHLLKRTEGNSELGDKAVSLLVIVGGCLVEQLPSSSPLTPSTLAKLLPPLVYLTDTQRQPPRSADPTFKATYADLTVSAQQLMSSLQDKLGDAAWVHALTAASRMMRGRREERKRKRLVERVTDPERAAQAKRRKAERKGLRKREIGRMYADRRRGLHLHT
ncbi:hypothetical protein DV735_g5684, partial [Chaetothyriales sp. CBS 134920]